MDPPLNPDGGYGKNDATVGGFCPVDECTLKVDIHIVSSDSVILGSHTRNLAFFENFPSPPQSVESEDKVIHLEEEAEVLQPLLGFMHNTFLPDLGLVTFSQLFAVAEAAEKYQIHSAMQICKIEIGHYTSKDPIGVWVYAVKYDYPALADKAAFLTLNHLTTELFLRAKKYKLKNASVMQWLRYREQWSLLFFSILNRRSAGASTCEHWERLLFNVISDIGDQLAAVRNFDEIVGRHWGELQLPQDCCLTAPTPSYRKKRKWERDWWLSEISQKIKGLKVYSDCIEV